MENNENTWYPQHLDRRTGKVDELDKKLKEQTDNEDDER